MICLWLKVQVNRQISTLRTLLGDIGNLMELLAIDLLQAFILQTGIDLLSVQQWPRCRKHTAKQSLSQDVFLQEEEISQPRTARLVDRRNHPTIAIEDKLLSGILR